jgi:hypothetical protein
MIQKEGVLEHSEDQKNIQVSVASLGRLVHNHRAPASPVGEVVAWGEDTWP